MNDHFICQELGQYALEPLQPDDRKLIAVVFVCGLLLLGGLFALQRCFPLAG